MNALKPGSFLRGDTYRIICFISSGGFGCTYEAEHVLLEKRVAIKEFFVKDFCNRDEETFHVTVGTQSKKGLVEKLRLKFIDEARSLSQLHHPGIVSVADVFEENGTAYFVMDYVEGHSLNEIVNQEGPLSEERAVRYIRQVAEALQYVHDNNRLHLDIKPGNIMINLEDRPVLIDFGASKQYDELDGENTSTLMGKTPGYAPPEQMSNSVVKFMPATDIYALGATLYKLLTGKTPLDVNLRISGEELEPMPPSISAAIRDAVAAAMAINKKNRPQNLQAFLTLLKTSPTPEIVKGEDTIIEVKENQDRAANTPNVAPKVPAIKSTKESSSKSDSSANISFLSSNWKIAIIGICVSILLFWGYIIFLRNSKQDICQNEIVSLPSAPPIQDNVSESKINIQKQTLNTTALELSTYYNTRFGFYITYPSYLYIQGESQNSDGKSFYSHNAEIKLTASAHFDLEGQSLSEMLNSEKKYLISNGCTITYSFSKNQTIVLSGYTSDEKIYYERKVKCSLFSPDYQEMVDIIATAYVVFPKDEKAKGDEIIKLFSQFPFKQ